MSDENLFTEIDNPQKRAYLISYTRTGSNNKASDSAQTERTTSWRWKRDDEQFKQAFSVADEIYSHNYLNELQQELKKRATDKTAQMSTIALFFALKAEAPDKYREKAAPLISGEVTIKLALPPREYIEGEYRELKEGSQDAIQGHTEAEGSSEGGGQEA